MSFYPATSNAALIHGELKWLRTSIRYREMLAFATELYPLSVEFVEGQWSKYTAVFDAYPHLEQMHIGSELKRDSAAYKRVMDAFAFGARDRLESLSWNMNATLNGGSNLGNTPREVVAFELQNFTDMRGSNFYITRAIAELWLKDDAYLEEFAKWNGGLPTRRKE